MNMIEEFRKINVEKHNKEMKTNHIENGREVGGDYFRLIYVRICNKTLQSHLDQFNPNDYNILKCSNKQKVVSYDDLLEFRYSSYIFFKKDLYDIDKIMEWVDWFNIKMNNKSGYLVRPTPPFNPNKIIVRK